MLSLNKSSSQCFLGAAYVEDLSTPPGWSENPWWPGTELLDWAVEDSGVLGCWCTEPAYDPPFQASPAPLADFLLYLEKKGKVKVRIECHDRKRDRTSYTGTCTEKVGFKIKDGNAKATNAFKHI